MGWSCASSSSSPLSSSSLLHPRRPRAASGLLYTTCLFLLEAYSHRSSAVAAAPLCAYGSSWAIAAVAVTTTKTGILAASQRTPAAFACTTSPSSSPSSSSSSSSSSHPSYTRRFLSMTRGGGGMDMNSRDQPTAEALRRPLIITGPSGVGKGTLIRRLLGEYPTRFGFSCSHTTRGPRPGEEEGVDYKFTTRALMAAAIEAGLFLEHATVHGNLYGTSFEAVQKVQDAGKICVLDIDVQGVISVKEAASRGKIYDLRPLYVFIAPPSLEILESRLRGRETETEEDVRQRTNNARKEVEYGATEGNFDKIVTNDDLETAYQDLKHYIEDMYYGGGVVDGR